MPLQVTYTYFPKKENKYDFNDPTKIVEILGEKPVPTKKECEDILNKLMVRRDILVSDIHGACIVVGDLSLVQEEGAWKISDYPESVVQSKASVTENDEKKEITSDEPVKKHVPKKDPLHEELKALMRGESFQSNVRREIYYDPPPNYMALLARQNNISRNGTYDDTNHLVINKKIYRVHAEANNPRGPGMICIVRNENDKLVKIPEHHVIDHSRDGLSGGPRDDNGPKLDFGRVVGDSPGDEIRRGYNGGGSAGSPISISDPSTLMKQFGIKANTNIPKT